MPVYPAVQFLVKRGNLLVWFLTIAPMFVAIVGIMLGLSWLWVLAAACVSPVVYLISKSYVELNQIIADVLLPQ